MCDHSTPSDDQFISPKGIFGRELGEVQGKLPLENNNEWVCN